MENCEEMKVFISIQVCVHSISENHVMILKKCIYIISCLFGEIQRLPLKAPLQRNSIEFLCEGWQ